MSARTLRPLITAVWVHGERWLAALRAEQRVLPLLPAAASFGGASAWDVFVGWGQPREVVGEGHLGLMVCLVVSSEPSQKRHICDSLQKARMLEPWAIRHFPTSNIPRGHVFFARVPSLWTNGFASLAFLVPIGSPQRFGKQFGSGLFLLNINQHPKALSPSIRLRRMPDLAKPYSLHQMPSYAQELCGDIFVIVSGAHICFWLVQRPGSQLPQINLLPFPVFPSFGLYVP